MEDKDFMNSDFEADFFAPLSEEETVVKHKKEKKPVNKKKLFWGWNKYCFGNEFL